MSVLTEFPGIKNRVEQLEGYVYSGSDYEEGALITDVKKKAKAVKISEKEDLMTFKPAVKKAVRAKARKIQDYLIEDAVGAESDVYQGYSGRKFQAVSRNIALIQDMQRKRRGQELKTEVLYGVFDEDYDYEEFVYEAEKPMIEDFEDLEEVPLHAEVPAEYSEEKIKSSTFMSPDLLEEHSRQLRGQVFVFVNKRLHDFDIELQQAEGNLAAMRKKIDFLEKISEELGQKLTFMDESFNQRAGDLAALKEMAENHKVSIVTIMHHLDRKAEAYAVNQKVSRKELTVIEDRVLKLCATASSEITKLEGKIDDSVEKFNFELNKKLFSEEFELRLEFLLHKLKMFENKLKNIPIVTPALDKEGIRPVEIKKYVVCKGGTNIKQSGRKITSWNSSDSIIPMLTQHHTDKEASPKTTMQIQKELELASYRESKRYVEGAYTKTKFGKK